MKFGNKEFDVTSDLEAQEQAWRRINGNKPRGGKEGTGTAVKVELPEDLPEDKLTTWNAIVKHARKVFKVKPDDVDGKAVFLLMNDWMVLKGTVKSSDAGSSEEANNG
jgi:hypothetical protein